MHPPLPAMANKSLFLRRQQHVPPPLTVTIRCLRPSPRVRLLLFCNAYPDRLLSEFEIDREFVQMSLQKFFLAYWISGIVDCCSLGGILQGDPFHISRMKFMKLESKPDDFQTDGNNIRFH